MAFNFTNEVVAFLKKNVGKFFTARQIAEYIAENFPHACEEKIKNSKNLKNLADCIRQYSNEIGAHKDIFPKKGVSMTSDRPRRYYIVKQENQKDNENNAKRNNQLEKELYPVLAKYCFEELNINTLRIDEKTSSKDKGEKYNHWLHADVVGFKDLISDFEQNTKDCLIEYADERSLLYSFEVKDGVLETKNLREAFFQTVSNSSWANYSYLVAENVNEGAEEELQLLCASFKIGFIKLNKENPLESKIEIAAPKKPLDWGMMNRIAKVNKDFRKYLDNITLVYQGHQNSRTKKPIWDIKEKKTEE